MHKKID